MSDVTSRSSGFLQGSAGAVETAGAPRPPLPGDGSRRGPGGGAGERLSTAPPVGVSGCCCLLLMDLGRNCTCKARNLRHISLLHFRIINITELH